MPYDPVTTDPPDRDPDYPSANVAVRIPSAGETLLGVCLVAQGPGPHPCLVLLHGFPGNEKNTDLAQAVRRSGWNVLLLHYRGAWGSGGTYTFGHVLEDVGSALAFLRTQDTTPELRLDVKRLALAGHSLGGWAALRMLAADADVLGAAGLATFDAGTAGEILAEISAEQAAQSFGRAFESSVAILQGASSAALADEMRANYEDWGLMNHAPALAERPVLLVAAAEDEVAPGVLHHTPLVAAIRAANGGKLTEESLDADHDFCDRRVTLAQILVNWLDRL